MLLLTMEAQVPSEKQDRLRRAYTHVMSHRPQKVLLSLLTQDNFDPSLWRIMTAWESEAAVDAYYASANRMLSAYVFHLIGVVPIAMVSDIVSFA